MVLAMGVGRGGRGWLDPQDFEIFSKNCCFHSFEWEKLNFITFGPPMEKFRQKTLVPPLKKFFPTPMVLARGLENFLRR